jgi:hypothetical protein
MSDRDRLTILKLPHTGFEVIQRQVADLVLDVVEIHREDWEEEDG